MTITVPLVLPTDVSLVPVAELPTELRQQLGGKDEDYAITRPRSRSASRIIDPQAATFLEQFRTATTLVDAVISYSQATGADPEKTLEEAYSMVRRLLDARILVPAHSGESAEIRHSFEVGEQIAGFTVMRCVQVLEDTELYQVRTPTGNEAALKLSRADAFGKPGGVLEREAVILKHLGGGVSPELYTTGTVGGQSYIVMEWCRGSYATAVAAEARDESWEDSRRRLLQLSSAILTAYAELHRHSVVHSDVHPRNILVGANGSVRIVDYGLAHVADGGDRDDKPQRGGVGYFLEPEYTRAVHEGQHPPSSSFAGEQYSIAALLYLLITGDHYLEFSVDRSEMLQQIADNPILPFSARGATPWPEVERLLARALSKDPVDRFSSVGELAGHFRQVAAGSQERRAVQRTDVRAPSAAAALLLEELLRRVEVSGPLLSTGLPTGPTCSLTFGAAGIAYALYRIACARGDAALLALGDVWARRAARDAEGRTAFLNSELDVTPRTVGRTSPYHTASGVHAVQALISHAMGDLGSQHEATERFLLASKAPCENLDLTLGRAGSVLAASLLLATMPDNVALRDFGNDTLNGIWVEIDALPSIPASAEISYSGIAHGWAGILYSTLRWCKAVTGSPPSRIKDRLLELAELAEHAGRGVRWRMSPQRDSDRDGGYMSGWCHGTAGYIHLWTLAHQVFREEQYLDLAEKCAWNAWEQPDTAGSLCCGLSGRAYGLLNFYKHSGEGAWLHRAWQLAERAVPASRAGGQPVDSLYKGQVGVAVLIADLEKPQWSSMPFFETEGWPEGPWRQVGAPETVRTAKTSVRHMRPR